MTDCNILIRGGELIDGSGAPRQRGDLALKGDRIAAIGSLDGWTADAVIEAEGMVVAPGFIDAHTHDDRAVLSGPDMTPKISQGVTTVVAGNCGVSLAPLDLKGDPPPPMNLLGDRDWYRFKTMRDYVETVEREPAALNIAMLVGHSTLRAGVMDRLDRAATAAEIEAMSELLDEALAAGAIGMSTGLAYPTAIAAPTDEVIALARHLAPHGAIYTTHMRDESDGVLDSIDETVRIGREAGVAVVISHHKCSGEANWGRSTESLAKIAEARGHMRLDLDVYPYAASSTVLAADWIEGKHEVQITWSKAEPDCAGRMLSAIAADWGCSQDEAIDRLQPAGAIYFSMDEGDLQRILSFPDAMVGSDGLPHDERPHPRLWGTFPRVLGHYSRELGLLSLEEAVSRMTGVTAAVFGLADRGRLSEGAFADVVVFDPETVIDRASYESPELPAEGIALVIVNGQAVWRDREWSGARPGRLLRREAEQ